MYMYLVTAKHVIRAAQRAGNLYLRLNTANGVELIEVDPNSWVTSPDDDGADVAVVPVSPSHSYFDYSVVASELFATDELVKEKQIGIGEDLLAIGLHAHRYGKGRNLPIVRTGIIACMPRFDEPLYDNKTGLYYQAYLAELRSIGGLSGSPVFAMLGRGRLSDVELGGKLNKGFLIGLIRGHYDQPMALADSATREIEVFNQGIAIVTPIQEVLKIIYGEVLSQARRDNEEGI